MKCIVRGHRVCTGCGPQKGKTGEKREKNFRQTDDLTEGRFHNLPKIWGLEKREEERAEGAYWSQDVQAGLYQMWVTYKGEQR